MGDLGCGGGGRTSPKQGSTGATNNKGVSCADTGASAEGRAQAPSPSTWRAAPAVPRRPPRKVARVISGKT
eukprot:3518212-Pyramimonas_sp.AAC.1